MYKKRHNFPLFRLLFKYRIPEDIFFKQEQKMVKKVV